MTIRIDNELLAELGLASLRDETKPGFVKFIYETLELRVGKTLADQMTDEQLDEFELLIDGEDGIESNRDDALAWLQKNFPFYPQVVQQSFTELKAEIAEGAPAILAEDRRTAPKSNRNEMDGAA
ncbi:hypothetical protein SAMN05892883_2799 [Jatrophihabitans sp. GAS493]|jgi:DNA-binding GntR family transcriptional regulator|uniref:DUF5663 domain-containing protein n=1 Tax=Jatrophihabitans sp. GAS493 TaxID=1907575 RepID=UPI000BB954ED|nr:DUF5663 domain-containing protein [Jatrophihabitans sp. GAS493]SOD73505.1 hypothetical protein SAMN05892883_2799 [Jatrophihabitans sp. GAS493]